MGLCCERESFFFSLHRAIESLMLYRGLDCWIESIFFTLLPWHISVANISSTRGNRVWKVLEYRRNNIYNLYCSFARTSRALTIGAAMQRKTAQHRALVQCILENFYLLILVFKTFATLIACARCSSGFHLNKKFALWLMGPFAVAGLVCVCVCVRHFTRAKSN